MSVTVPCSDCSGEGGDAYYGKCSSCLGSGLLPDPRIYVVADAIHSYSTWSVDVPSVRDKDLASLIVSALDKAEKGSGMKTTTKRMQDCPYYKGVGSCDGGSCGVLGEPICITEEPEGGWDGNGARGDNR